MKKITTIAAIINLIIPAFCLANNNGNEEEKPKDIFIKFLERDENNRLHYISNSRWLPVRSTLVIAYNGTEFKYTFFGEKGNKIGSGKYPPKPVFQVAERELEIRDKIPGIIEAVDVKKTLKDKTGKTYVLEQGDLVILSIEDRYYRGAKSLTIEYWPTDHEKTQRYFKKFEIIKTRFDWAELSNFAITPLVNIQIGKNNPTGEQVEGTSFALGVEYLFFYKHREYRFWDNLGGGLSYSYSKTPVWDETAQEWEDTLVATTGVVLAFKFWSTPLMAIGGVGWNLNGDDRFLQILFGFSVKPGD